jgi:predicted O-methyltransferase YrrM
MAYTVSWFLNNVDLWEEKVVKNLPETPRILEIGVFEGMSTCWLASKYPNSILDSIDTFVGSMENGVVSGLYERFLKNVEPFKNRINIHIGESYQHVRKFDKEYFDFIYVDGSHQAKDVLIDAIQSFYSLKHGGVMVFDDYEWHAYPNPNLCPQKGIDIFLDLFNDELNIIHKDYQLIIIKK